MSLSREASEASDECLNLNLNTEMRERKIPSSKLLNLLKDDQKNWSLNECQVRPKAEKKAKAKQQQ